MKNLLLITTIIMVILKTTAQEVSFDEAKPYLEVFKSQIEIPNEFHFYTVSQVISNGVEAYLFRYQKDANKGFNREHFSFLVSKNDRQILGFTNMNKKYNDLNMISRKETEKIAKELLVKIDKSLADDLENLWIERHDEQIFDENGKAITISGMKFKCYRSVKDDYAWIIVGFDGSIVTFERNVKWNTQEHRRITEKWLHDSWIIDNKGNNKSNTALLMNSNTVSAQNYFEMEETIIRNLIEDSYLNGALNQMDTDAMYKGYHPDFAIFYAEGKELKELPLDVWVKMVNAYKQSSDDNGLRKFEYEFVQIDVNETAAFVKLKLIRKGTLIFTDLLTLLKFENQWKIVTKIYHSHIENPWEL